MVSINTALLRMMTAFSGLRARFSEQRGQDLLEYSLLGGLIAVSIIAVALLFGDALTAMAGGIRNCIDFTASTVCDPGP
ncbi:MAG: hypothetical protein IIC88_02540 [Chloroflexi bacterium]|nr:hypothetical protein [Chloroflexota bacterium]